MAWIQAIIFTQSSTASLSSYLVLYFTNVELKFKTFGDMDYIKSSENGSISEGL